MIDNRVNEEDYDYYDEDTEEQDDKPGVTAMAIISAIIYVIAALGAFVYLIVALIIKRPWWYSLVIAVSGFITGSLFLFFSFLLNAIYGIKQ